MAVASMVTSIGAAALVVCAICVGFIGIVAAAGGATGAVLGHVARRQARERQESGEGMALAGIVVGWIAVGLGVLVVVLNIIWIGATFATFGTGVT